MGVAVKAMRRAWAVGSAVLALSMAGGGLVRPAQACGGTFCDGGPNAMPVEQTGETVLFVVEDGHVEAHIQIAYDPEARAEEFAWVVPVTAIPELSVGSQQLFSSLLGATAPVYGAGQWNEPCGGGAEADPDSCDEFGDDGGGSSEKLDAAGGSGPGAPEVVQRSVVGAFEVFVLDGGTADGVMQWLGDNGFAQDEAARPILEEYLAEDHLFVAFRLTARAEASEIHPIVLRYEGQEPCVPIRLTRIAAQEDLEIRVFVLADGRFASSNYRDVTINPLKIDWANPGDNYRQVVSRAIDEPGADGRAFVTEYAGPSDPVPRNGILDPQWDPEPFALATEPLEAVQLLLQQQLVGYNGQQGECEGSHPLVEGLVARYLPTPEAVPFSYLCDDPELFAGLADPKAWIGGRFAADLETRVVDPGIHANELLDTWPYLTRLYTLISPHEMTVDPMFHGTPELPDRAGLSQIGTRNVFCDGGRSFSLPDGTLVAASGTGQWPDIAPGRMPWAQIIASLPAAGAPLVEVDNGPRIAALLDQWNRTNGPPPSPTSAASVECEGGPGPWDDGPTVGGVDQAAGCGCRTRGQGSWAWMLMVGAMVLGWRRSAA